MGVHGSTWYMGVPGTWEYMVHRSTLEYMVHGSTRFRVPVVLHVSVVVPLVAFPGARFYGLCFGERLLSGTQRGLQQQLKIKTLPAAEERRRIFCLRHAARRPWGPRGREEEGVQMYFHARIDSCRMCSLHYATLSVYTAFPKRLNGAVAPRRRPRRVGSL